MSQVEYKSSGAGGGVGFFSILFFIFLVLKLTEVINWSWWWVTAPLWLPLVVSLAVGVVAGLIFLVAWLIPDKGVSPAKKNRS
ncbi:hypothetical protein BJD55_gp092 [Gordonia phage Yvonnetastic]|uniref:Uncharacterized protein n=1 Tax=Gordonia phage Yvonnetastic TaxID=1821566 RepID=A0A142K991_9CAUD|nr:hypothetical protein BJD55_gp092 [Gordonia phage Yvonnetastic]AMS02674.1 hypothetical protein SEA_YVONNETASTIC_130 [Gordonia phage Yvonnetastic]